MKKHFLTLLIICCFSLHSAYSQNDRQKDFRNFPIVLTLQFHALSMPFKDIQSNFKNVGIGIGTEVSHNGYHNWAQQFGIIWYRNKQVGNGILFSTQTAWRPYLVSDFYGEIKAGIGYLISFRPVESFIQKDGEWISTGKKGKGMLAIPVGVSLGYHNHSQNMYYSPFFGYQIMLVKGYNKSIPFVPETFIQLGTRIHPNYSQTYEK